ncbi:hypothetical protein BGZ82_007331 [Podila clonocystis]|nr:hypothetical protein BGZ82_007331 [Podila clonocystis]
MAPTASRPVAHLDRYFLGLGNAHIHIQSPGPGPKELPRSKGQWLSLLTPALATDVQRHPLMSTYIAGHLTTTPTFQAMSSIDLSKIIVVDSIQQSMDITKFWRWSTTNPPLPLALEQRVDCTPSLKTRVRHFLHQVIMPAWHKKAFEPQFRAGEFPATASNETQLGIVVLNPEETSQVIAAARRKHTTVNSVLFTSFLFAIKAVFLSSSHSDNKDAKKGATMTTQDLFSALTVTCPRSMQLFSSPVEQSEHVLCIADLWTQGHAVELETEFWSFTREYHAQVVRHVRTPRKLQRLLENYGALRYMPGSP